MRITVTHRSLRGNLGFGTKESNTFLSATLFYFHDKNFINELLIL